MIKEDYKEFYKLFTNKNYDEIHKILFKNLKSDSDNIELNIFLFFFYDCIDNIREKEQQYKKLIILFNNKKDELYYYLGFICNRITNNHLSFYTYEDVLRFYKLAINENNKNAEALFEVGKLLINYNKNIKKGLNYINQSIFINNQLEKNKVKFLTGIYVYFDYQFDKFLYTKKQISVLLNELDRCNDKFKDNKFYLQKIKFCIALNKLENAKNE